MALGKAVNKKSFYGGTETGGIPDIAMPPLDQAAPIQTAVADPWESTPQSQQAPDVMAPVPDRVPQEVTQEMANSTEETTDKPQISTETQENTETIDEVVPQQKHSKKETSAAENMRALREARERAERERDELIRILQMQQLQQQSQQKQPEPEPENLEIQDDALVEGKHVRQMHKKIQELERRVQENLSRTAESMTEARIKTSYPDFDKVVSSENIELFKQQYPELAQTLHSTADLYSKAVSAYTLIKQFGIYKDPVFENDRQRALKNANKPRPLASVSPQQSDSPLSRANAFASGELTEEMKAQYRKEMYQYRKNM